MPGAKPGKLQRSRVRENAEIGDGRGGVVHGGRSFNGAASVRTRKYTALNVESSPNPQLQRSRVRENAEIPQNPVVLHVIRPRLQRSRVRENAEIKYQPAPTIKAIPSFNGAASVRTRKYLLRHGLGGMNGYASTEPRP